MDMSSTPVVEVVVRRCTVAELEAAPNLPELLAEYARESSMRELGDPCPQVDTYRRLESAGVFYPIAAFEGECVAGFILPIVVALPHYGAVAATVESFFVPRAKRAKGLGLRLLAEAEALARDLGAKALLLSAPVGGTLARALHRKRAYRHSNDVFVRPL
jgi:GNAT superfamily N-acetyltransferase